MTPNGRRFPHFFDLCVPKTPSVSRDGSGDCNQARVLETIHFGPSGAHRGREVEAERLGGLEIDHQLVLGRRLHRQVGRLLAFENAVDIAGRAPVRVDRIRTIRD